MSSASGRLIVFGSLGLLGLFRVPAQSLLPGTQQRVRAVWITEGTLPTRFLGSSPPSHPTTQTGPVYLEDTPSLKQ